MPQKERTSIETHNNYSDAELLNEVECLRALHLTKCHWISRPAPFISSSQPPIILENSKSHPNCERMSHDSRKERLIQITLDLLRHRMSQTGERELPINHSHSSWSQAVSEALKFADLTLRRIEDRDVDVHAYQLFEENEMLTFEKISDRFTETNWGALHSKRKVEEAIEEIWNHIEKEETSLEPEDSDARNIKLIKIYARIRDAFDALRTDEDISAVYPELDEKLEGIMSQIQPEADYAQSAELLATRVEHQAFMRWSREERQHPKHKTQKAKYYRPHGIFLYAAVHGLNTGQLIKTWSGLSDEFVPYPEKDLQFAISLLPVPDPWTLRDATPK